MKNLVMGVATNYDWYAIEPFVTSLNRYCKNADLVLFVDNISEFTRATLQKGGGWNSNRFLTILNLRE